MEIRFCTPKDIPLADKVLRHPDVYGMCLLDSKPENPEEYSVAHRILAGPPTYVLMDDTNSFVAILVPETNRIWSSHSNALPEIRGKKAIEVCNAMVQWMFDNTPCNQIIGFTPQNHKAARMFNRLCGFREILTLKNAFSIRGVIENAVMVIREKDNV